MLIKETHITLPETSHDTLMTILDVHGTVDRTSVKTLVEAVQANIEKGSRRMIINLAGADNISSAGLVGLYMIGELLEGRSVNDLEGWAVIGRMRLTLEDGEMFSNLSLAAPSQTVTRALQNSSFDRLVRTLPTVDEAVAAFAAE